MTTTSTAAPAARTSIAYDTVPCGRCGATGHMPYSAYGGVCFDCRGAKNRLTPAARKVKALVDDFLALRLAVRMDELTPGLVTWQDSARRMGRATFVEYGGPDELNPHLELHKYVFTAETRFACADTLRYRAATIEDIEAAVAMLGKRKAGFTVTRTA